ncbi:MAG: SMI1/KNR4 family protein [Pseudomonadota bacterium]|nr:SMI1/KNR4 family protein [Pseudomonadota bacterium]
MRQLITPASGSLRLLLAALLLAGPALAGWLARSPWVILVFALVFAINFAIGRWAAWRVLLRDGPLSKWVASALSLLAVQAVLVTILYLSGAGIAAVLRGQFITHAMTMMDLLAALSLGLLCAVFARWLLRHETRAYQRALHGTPAMQKDEIRIDDKPVSLDDFYRGHHYAHIDGEGDLTPEAHGSEATIAAAETRLGIRLPDTLRALYLRQNGGLVGTPGANDLGIVRRGIGTPRLWDDLITPFSGYSTLNPCESLESAWTSFLAFADPADETNYGHLFANGTDQMIVLAQWYRETLFLDYRKPGPPQVGFVDFDDADWASKVIGWPDFDDFFSQLRRFESL